MTIHPSIILVSDPGPDRTHNCPTRCLLDNLDRHILSYDLCGRSWQERPKDLDEFIFNTFKPIFCAGRKALDTTPSQQLLRQVDWFVLTTGGDLLAVQYGGGMGTGTFSDTLSKAGLLVLASANATRVLLGSSIRVWYLRHVERNSTLGSDSPSYLKDVDLNSISPLASVGDMVRNRIEIVVFPPPTRGAQTNAFFNDEGADGVNFNDLRVNYLRRVHMKLGCDKHAIW